MTERLTDAELSAEVKIHADNGCAEGKWRCVQWAMLVELRELRPKAIALDSIHRRLAHAHTYCNTHKVGLVGDNVWHVILDDAIRVRAELSEWKEWGDGQIRDAVRAIDQNAKLRTALEDVEWVVDPDSDYRRHWCPKCHGFKPVHIEGCELAAALATPTDTGGDA